MDLSELIRISRKYGADPEYVLAGGGNTSYKENGVMAVKASGKALSASDEGSFVLMDEEKLRGLPQADYPDGDKAREALVLEDMMAARHPGQGDIRPSVECILHALFPQKYVLHMHPPLVNGLTCGMDGEAAAKTLFEDMKGAFLWAGLTKPGFILSKTCAGLFEKHTEVYGCRPQILILQNHGIFVAADEPEEACGIMADACSRISGAVTARPDLGVAGPSPETAATEARAADVKKTLESLYGGAAIYLYNNEIARFTAGPEAYTPLMKPFTPDHIVYCRAYPAFAGSEGQLAEVFEEYDRAHGGKPKITAVRGLGVFALGASSAEAGQTAVLYMDAVKIAVYSESFGGPRALPDEFVDFIVNWESEAYRQKESRG